MTDREEFEAAMNALYPAWAESCLWERDKKNPDNYLSMPTQIAWRSWQASRASREGWVSVPKEPTEAMLRAMGAHANFEGDIFSVRRKALYKILIAAAQEKEEGK